MEACARDEKDADPDDAEDRTDPPAQDGSVCRCVGDTREGGEADDEQKHERGRIEALPVGGVLPVASLGPAVDAGIAHGPRVSGRAERRRHRVRG